MWLDRGERDKTIERSTTTSPAPAPPQMPSFATSNDPNSPYTRSYKHDSDHDFDRGGYRKRKKRGFLGELFDFD